MNREIHRPVQEAPDSRPFAPVAGQGAGENGQPPLDPHRWAALAVVSAAVFLGVLDFFIVNVSIPAIRLDLDASLAEVQLMIACYILAYAVLLITGGRLGDIYGRKRMFLIGMAGFTLASTLCGLAVNPAMLIFSRILQGIMAALMFPQVLSIIQVSFPPHERGRAFGIFGTVAGSGSFSGNLLGGLLVHFNLFGLGWRPIFLVNLPVGLISLVAAVALLRESRSPKARRLDLAGVIIVSLGLLLFVYPLVQGREAGWPVWAVFLSLVASVPVLAGFVFYEWRIRAAGGSPLLELDLFHDRVFVVGLVTTLVYYCGLSAFFLIVTLFMQYALNFSALQAGLTFAPFGLGFLIASNSAARLAQRFGNGVIHMGVGLMATSVVTLVALTFARGLATSLGELVPVLLIYGIGQGLVMPTLVTTVLSGVHGHDAGSAAGVLTTVQQVALAIGVAVIVSAFYAVLDRYGGPEAGATWGYVAAADLALLLNLVLLLIALGLAFLLPRVKLDQAEVPATPLEM
jgi:EmrB/QacA subfamily drug resistance transporter